MNDLIRSTFVEFAKLKRTLVFWVVLAVPVVDGGMQQFLVMHTRDAIPIEDMSAMPYIAKTMAIFWAHLLYPLEIAVVTAMVNGNEHANSTWKVLFQLPVSRSTIYLSKFFAASLLLLFSNIVLLGDESPGQRCTDAPEA